MLVRVSVVALPTKVSVEVGNVKVPVLLIELIIGLVKVLFVSVCVPVRVTTVESIFKVTGPDTPPPLSPVPAVTEVISPEEEVLVVVVVDFVS